METKQRDELIKGKRKQKKKRRFFKKLLIFLSFVVIALAAFVITIKVTTPDFDFTTLIPKKAYTIVDEKVLGHTTTTTTTKAPKPTLTTASTKPLGHYLPHKEFKFDFDKKGNLVGSILNGGNAWHDDTYIYHLIPGYGVYRMFPGTEEDARLLSNKDRLCCLNVSASKLYFVNATNGNLYKMNKNGSTPSKLAENIKTAYLYGETLYLITKNNEIATMNTEKQKLKIIRKVECKELNFIGISKGLIYVEAVFENRKSYVCIDKKGKKHAVDFRLENEGEIVKPVMEDGFLYYYKKEDNEYNLCRQKFGSEKVVTLIKNTYPSAYAAVENNRLFYCEMSSGRYCLKELNMNSKNHKLLLSVKADSPDYMSFCHGGTYDFVYGKRSENGERVYASSCILTSSSRVMYFKDAHWKY